MQFSGKIKKILPMVHVGDKKTPKVEFVVTEQSGNYEEGFVFTLFGDKSNQLSIAKIKEGDEVAVHFNYRVNESTKDGVTRYFNNITAWKVVKVEGAVDNGDDSDLPFN